MITSLLLVILTFSSFIYSMDNNRSQKITKREFNKAVRTNRPAIVKAYLESEQPDPKLLYRQLHSALDNNATGSVALLLRYGVPINIPYNLKGPTPIMKMTLQGNLEMIIWLKAMMADTKIEDKNGKNPLDIAFQKWEAAQAESEEEKLYYTIFHELGLFTQFTRMRQHRIKVPEELWNK